MLSREYKYGSKNNIIGKTEQNLTVSEKERGLIPEWVNPAKLLEICSRYDDFATINEDKRGSYLREYTALAEYVENAVSLAVD